MATGTLAKDAAIYVAGHTGMLGSAILRKLQEDGYSNLVTRRSADLDLTDQASVRAFFRDERIDCVVLAAGRVGGILANSSFPAQFIDDNLMIESNVIQAAYRAGVARLLFLGSACAYPKNPPQPIREEALLSGPLEPTNEPYAVAKIAGIKLCEAYNRQYGTSYRCATPTNLYGAHDNFDLRDSHVVPALIRKFHEAVLRGEGCVEVWGSGAARRELLYVEDAAAACVFLLALDDADWRKATSPSVPHLNVGTGEDVSIAELVAMVAEIAGYDGRIEFDRTRPEGVAQRRLDVSRLRALGWAPRTSLRDGLTATYAWFRAHEAGQPPPRAAVR